MYCGWRPNTTIILTWFMLEIHTINRTFSILTWEVLHTSSCYQVPATTLLCPPCTRNGSPVQLRSRARPDWRARSRDPYCQPWPISTLANLQSTSVSAMCKPLCCSQKTEVGKPTQHQKLPCHYRLWPNSPSDSYTQTFTRQGGEVGTVEPRSLIFFIVLTLSYPLACP